MTTKYYYKDKDIYYLTTSGTSANVSNTFAGFPTQDDVSKTYTSGISKPYDFGFKYNNEDVSNYCTAYFVEYVGNANVDNNTLDKIISQPINTNNINFKHISTYCYGGGGGGGKGGGSNNYGADNAGGGGGTGGAGGYAAVVNVPVSSYSNIYVYVGNGGAGNNEGGGKSSDSNGAEPGSPGFGGKGSFIRYTDVNGDTILAANGGAGGFRGNGASETRNGTTGGPGAAGTGVVNYTSSGIYTTTETFATSQWSWPPQTLGQGGVGGVGAKATVTAARGDGANAGYVGIYFLYS